MSVFLYFRAYIVFLTQIGRRCAFEYNCAYFFFCLFLSFSCDLGIVVSFLGGFKKGINFWKIELMWETSNDFTAWRRQHLFFFGLGLYGDNFEFMPTMFIRRIFLWPLFLFRIALLCDQNLLRFQSMQIRWRGHRRKLGCGASSQCLPAKHISFLLFDQRWAFWEFLLASIRDMGCRSSKETGRRMNLTIWVWVYGCVEG